MISVYWINLTRRPDKRLHMQKIINDYNSKNKINIRDTRITPIKTTDYISCCIAHFDAIHTAYQDNVDWAIICEDDIENFDFLNNPIIPLLLKNNDWHVIQLYYTCPILTNIMLEKVLENQEQRIVKGYLMGACCYLINKKGIEKFLCKMAVFNHKTREYELHVNFLTNAKSEEFIFRYIESRFLLIPLVNIINLGSDISSSLANEGDKNMENIKNIHNKLKEMGYDIQNLTFNDKLILLDYHMHWFSSKEECIKLLFEKPAM